MKNKEMFLKNSEAILGKIVEQLDNLEAVDLKTLDKNKTAVVIVDMVNGFVKKGALQSDRIASLVPEVVKIAKWCDELQIKKVVLADSHPENTPEFKSYPCHCVKGTEEAEVVNEIKTIGNYLLIEKNSTNGFIEPVFQKWLIENKEINNFIVVGDCTDICVLQFALTLKTHFNRINEDSRIIIPMNAVDTYDFETHNGDLMHLIGLYFMMINSIEIVKEIII
ncbi:cysteine hydrolase [Mycoplasmatota bacterium]|nr:cysteine hydrolase [Mycoplasmatota bacterium]